MSNEYSHKYLFYNLSFNVLKVGPLELQSSCLLIERLMCYCAKMTPPEKWGWSFRMSLKNVNDQQFPMS